jgi:hypothetical protein
LRRAARHPRLCFFGGAGAWEPHRKCSKPRVSALVSEALSRSVPSPARRRTAASTPPAKVSLAACQTIRRTSARFGTQGQRGVEDGAMGRGVDLIPHPPTSSQRGLTSGTAASLGDSIHRSVRRQPQCVRACHRYSPRGEPLRTAAFRRPDPTQRPGAVANRAWKKARRAYRPSAVRKDGAVFYPMSSRTAS